MQLTGSSTASLYSQSLCLPLFLLISQPSTLCNADHQLDTLEPNAEESKELNPQLCRTHLVLSHPPSQALHVHRRDVHILTAGVLVLVYAGQHRLGLLLQEVHQQDGEGMGWQGALCLPVHSHHTSRYLKAASPTVLPLGSRDQWSFSMLLVL